MLSMSIFVCDTTCVRIFCKECESFDVSYRMKGFLFPEQANNYHEPLINIIKIIKFISLLQKRRQLKNLLLIKKPAILKFLHHKVLTITQSRKQALRIAKLGNHHIYSSLYLIFLQQWQQTTQTSNLTYLSRIYKILQIIEIKAMTQNYNYKIVLIGDSSVGKSSLLRRFADDSFEESYLATIGVDFKFKTLEFDNNSVKMQIWDTAGQQRFRTITSAYYKSANGIILVFDLKNKITLENLQTFWLDQIRKYSENQVQLVAVGNKADCEDLQLQEDQLAAFSLKHGLPCMRVSAKTGDGVNQAFQVLAKNCIKKFGKTNSQEKNSVVDDIRKKKAEFKLKTGQQQKKNKKCC